MLRGNLRITNIFNPYSSSEFYWLPLPYFEFIQNTYTLTKRYIKYQEMVEEFQHFGFSLSDIETAISELSIIDLIQQKGFIWIDGDYEIFDTKTIRNVDDDATINLLPAGIAFLDQLSISKEYAFWSVISAPLDNLLFERPFSLKTTYLYEFQLDVILKAIELKVIPDFETEVKLILSNKNIDSDLINHYWNYFSINYLVHSSNRSVPKNLRDLYPVRLIRTLYYSATDRYLPIIEPLLERIVDIQNAITRNVDPDFLQ